MTPDQEHTLALLLERYHDSYGVPDLGETMQHVKEDLYALIDDLETNAFSEGVSFANRISGR